MKIKNSGTTLGKGRKPGARVPLEKVSNTKLKHPYGSSHFNSLFSLCFLI